MELYYFTDTKQRHCNEEGGRSRLEKVLLKKNIPSYEYV